MLSPYEDALVDLLLASWEKVKITKIKNLPWDDGVSMNWLPARPIEIDWFKFMIKASPETDCFTSGMEAHIFEGTIVVNMRLHQLLLSPFPKIFTKMRASLDLAGTEGTDASI